MSDSNEKNWLMSDVELEQTAMGLIKKTDSLIPALCPSYLGCAAAIFNYLASKQKEKDEPGSV